MYESGELKALNNILQSSLSVLANNLRDLKRPHWLHSNNWLINWLINKKYKDSHPTELAVGSAERLALPCACCQLSPFAHATDSDKATAVMAR